MKDVTFLVMRKGLCPDCHGSGWVSNGAFELVWTVWTERPEPRPPLMDVALELGFEEVPAEEEVCMRCSGGGEVEEWVPLEEALRMLGALDHTATMKE